VTSKEPGGIVHLALRADNQRSETTAAGSATVILPDRPAGS
jgi:acyl dehydratase